MLDKLMCVSINGPKLLAFDPLPIFRKWHYGSYGNSKGRHIFKNTIKQTKLKYYTVQPVFKDHPLEQTNLVFVHMGGL